MTNALDIAIERFKNQLKAQKLNEQGKDTWKDAYLHRINLQKQSINSERYKNA